MPRRPDLPCAGCGALLWRGSKSLPDGEAKCRPCRRLVHGTAKSYKKRGCRCVECKAAAAKECREYAARYKERTGKSSFARYRPIDSYRWIAPAVRVGVYERDEWTCQLCAEPVDPNLDLNDRMAATLDHIVCRSWVLVPDDSPENLRLAHRACNSRRRDGYGREAA